MTVSLTPSNHNGYNITCFGKKNGAIDATVTGGTAPYSFTWSNGSSAEDIADLAAGYYKLVVTDSLNASAEAEITLVEPTALRLAAAPFTYPNGLNLSCHECYNGSIDVTATDGVPPYTYAWDDNATTADRSGLGALTYTLIVTDANGCQVNSQRITLTQPERSDWRMDGNTGTDPAQHYLGTRDSTDFVFKSNGQERLRLLGNGEVKLTSQLINPGVVYIDALGQLRGGGFPPNKPPMPPGVPCYNLDQFPPFWETRGNDFTDLCLQPEPLLGTRSNHALRIVTDGIERIHITSAGKVGIGTAPPAGAITNWR
ncbi:MAG TPA: SprB repeat-containing protein, partial [Flavobacteriales bacterium]|nr:SprB repeat-containing protein [Flavobacteriales bacterium]